MSNLSLVKFEKSSEPSQDQQQVISILEDAIKHAKEGNYTSLCLSMLHDDGSVLDCWHSGGRPYVMIGAIEALKADFIAANIEPR